MAQLKDDCFAFGGELTPLNDALAMLRSRVRTVVDVEHLPLDECLDKFLAENVIADRNVPPHDNSAVDGFAVYFCDLKPDAGTRLPFTARIAAGHPLGRPAVHGEALRIFTGAPMPVGADGSQASGPDTVFMEEDVKIEGDVAVFPPGLKRGSNRRNAGEDVAVGSVILTKGLRLRPQELGLAASIGRETLCVFKPLRVGVFSTGDEVVDPESTAPEGRIFDANRYAIKALLHGSGCVVTDLGILPDNRETIAAALKLAAQDHDMLMTSGGVSAGEEDHVKSAVEQNGSINLWRLAIKPGRPIALGQINDTAFIGLPGNPVAAMITFLVVARPLIFWMTGAEDTGPMRYSALSGFDHKKKKGRREWVRVRLEDAGDGTLVAKKDVSSGAGILTSMVAATALVELDEDTTEVSSGDRVKVLSLSEMMA